MRARKHFGQHFLTDGNIIRKIIGAMAPQPGEHFVEIGP
ncbi:MAG: rRNA adenine N-6-methyltransferase family protein, partial [Gammaproteobacteria bacterium]|nr:rRNA adenine N-6-methyltransferase family protein [Gammaproteobacteria bacterium]